MIDKKAVIQALDDMEPGNLYFIDRRTSKVQRYTLQDKAGLESLKKSVRDEPQRFAQIPKPEPRENFAELEAFVATVHDPKLKEALRRAMTSHRPFREFRDLLATKVKERREWEAFHAKNLEQRAARFLKSAGLS